MCTTISYMSHDNKVFLARNQDFQYEQRYMAVAVGRRQKLYAMAEESFDCLYAMVGIGVDSGGKDGAHILCMIDGVNEQGLACTQSYFAEFADYADESQIREAGKTPIRAEFLTAWILSNCKDVDDAIIKLHKVACVDQKCPLTGSALPQHFFLRDKYGKCAVFEPSVKCGFEVYDNPTGVLTNSPGFEWQMTNLSYYQHLSPEVVPGGIYDGYEMATRKAAGQMGMPGDYSSPSRFVRAAYFVHHMLTPENDEEAVAAGLMIAGAMSVPKGAVNTGTNAVFYTQYTVVTDVEEGTIYLKFYGDHHLRRLNLHDFDLETLHYFSCEACVSREAAAPHPIADSIL